MANTKKNNGSAAKKVAEPTYSAKTVNEIETPVVNVVQRQEEKLPSDLQVPCVSMVKLGKLIYQSKRQMGYRVVWESFLESQLVELSELIAMKNNALDFFKNNWIVIPDSFEYKDQVLKELRIAQYYKSVPDPYALNDLFILSIDEMVERIGSMTETVRDSLRGYVKDAVANGEVDSYKRIRALEDALSCKLT